MSPNHEYFLAATMIVCGGTAMFGDPDKSRFRKWNYWCFAPLFGAVCGGFAFNSVAAALGVGAIWATLFVCGYFRYWK
jgi:hypothetical protein